MRFFGLEREQRKLVSIKQIPPFVVHAVLAAEDARFFQHHGLDPKGIFRALYTNLRYGTIRQGGSTITQQLVKNYFLSSERTFSRKIQEIFLAITMEVLYEKKDILEIYLNEIYFGQKDSIAINGIGEAALFYYGKEVHHLTLAEAATIGGLIRAPNLYSPYINPSRAMVRRSAVLQSMLRRGWITSEEFNNAITDPLEPAGYTAYGRKAPYFIDYLTKQLETLYSSETLASLGLSIYTTLNSQVQIAAEQALEKGLSRLETRHPRADDGVDPTQRLQGAILVMQPKTGYILAMVGGRNYNQSQFNRIAQARRQPGSVFKPLVYAAAMKSFSPASLLSNQPRTYHLDGKTWNPRNAQTDEKEIVTMREALAHSLNVATVDLAMQIGLETVVAKAKTFRLSTPLTPFPSLALGSSEVLPLELARAYCAFAADGLLPYPLSLHEVLDEEGNILERRHMTIEQVLSPGEAFLISSMLRTAVETGTGRDLKDLGVLFPVAGKTGTTNDFKDAWFVGYTPDILALVWVGYDDGTPINASGASAALPIWADLVKAIPQYHSGQWFRRPPGIITCRICPETGKKALRFGCPNPVDEVFLEEMVPQETCDRHGKFGPFNKFMESIKDLFNEP
jgi:penicillin-binding protein 1B